jgi:hypothetical protein
VVTDVAGLFPLNLRGRSLGIVPADGWGSIGIPRIAAIGMLSLYLPSVVNTAVLPVTPEPSQSAAVAPLAVPAGARQGDPKPAEPAPEPAQAAPPGCSPAAPQN